MSRTLGKNHEGSMIVARQIQGLFDIAASGPGEAETLKNRQHEDVTTAQGNVPDRGRQYRR